ncbi:MAG: methyltransferase domain-containing protein [Candidatus Cloacimonetes bacterium]|nr:methyltransferase domain-containing protein [Candidatus Cloacimonadota bacterium]
MPAEEKVILPDGETVINQSVGQPVSSDTAFLVEILSQEISPKMINILDVGCGNGIIALMLARRFPATRITGIDIQPGLINLALKNADCCRVNVDFLKADLRKFSCIDKFNIIVANPPYFAIGSGRMGTDDERNRSRFELDCNLPDVIDCIARNCKPDGNAYVMYPAMREAQLTEHIRKNGMMIVERWVSSGNNKREARVYKIIWEKADVATAE